jgi:hypothetical protein
VPRRATHFRANPARGIYLFYRRSTQPSPESSNSACEDPTRYNPNLSEEEPLFSARIVSSDSVSVMRQPSRKYCAHKVQRQWRTYGRSSMLADRELVTLHRRPVARRHRLHLIEVDSLASLLPRQRTLSVAEEWLPSRRRALARLSRRGRLALLCWLSLLLRLCPLGLLLQIRLHFVVGHNSCCHLSPVDRHWPASGGCTCGETALEASV